MGLRGTESKTLCQMCYQKGLIQGEIYQLKTHLSYQFQFRSGGCKCEEFPMFSKADNQSLINKALILAFHDLWDTEALWYEINFQMINYLLLSLHVAKESCLVPLSLILSKGLKERIATLNTGTGLTVWRRYPHSHITDDVLGDGRFQKLPQDLKAV